MMNDKTKKRIKRALLCLLLLLFATAIIWAVVSNRTSHKRPKIATSPTPKPTRTEEPKPNEEERYPEPERRTYSYRRQTPSRRLVTRRPKYRCPLSAPSLEVLREIERNIAAIRAANPTPRVAGSVTIPVYFHVLTNADGRGDVSDAKVRRQIDVLNTAFAGNGPGGTGHPTPFKFELKEIDRTANNEWFNMTYLDDPVQAERDAKAALNKGDGSALNIYTIELTNKPYGWARWPWDLANGLDGIVIGYKTLPGGGLLNFDQGDTATHEVGHWLGLFHTYEGGCTSPGDYVDDTPPETGGFCNIGRNTCSGGDEDAITNFMNSTDDLCIFTFSAGQSDRMDAIHLQYRPAS